MQGLRALKYGQDVLLQVKIKGTKRKQALVATYDAFESQCKELAPIQKASPPAIHSKSAILMKQPKICQKRRSVFHHKTKDTKNVV